MKYIADHVYDPDRATDAEVTEQTRFSAAISYDLVSTEEFNQYESKYDNIESLMDPIQRTCRAIDIDMVFCFYLYMCLQNAPSRASDINDLVELLETKHLALPKDVERFRNTYSPDQALRVYSKDPFIYVSLNHALQTTNIAYLLPFCCIVRDICNQLREIMAQEADNQSLTVFRGQRSSMFEIIQLLSAYHSHHTIMSTAFLSTSKDRECALNFISALGIHPLDIYHPVVLFKITARKRDASPYFPFADISKISNHPEEEEVLFAPGQMFKIDHFDAFVEKDTTIFLCEMSLHDGYRKNCDQLTATWNMDQHPFSLYGRLLIERGRIDEARTLYTRLQSACDDEEDKLYYRVLLYGIDLENNKAQATISDGEDHASGHSLQPTSEADPGNAAPWKEQEEMLRRMPPLTGPIQDILRYMQSSEFIESIKQRGATRYSMAMSLIVSSMYDMAILVLKLMLSETLPMLEFQKTYFNPSIHLDPLLKPRCYRQLGYCYLKTEKYVKALENYELALEQTTPLPLNEYIAVLSGIGCASEATGNYQEALYKYIEIAEIYNSDATSYDPEQIRTIEGHIERVLSHFITPDIY